MTSTAHRRRAAALFCAAVLGGCSLPVEAPRAPPPSGGGVPFDPSPFDPLSLEAGREAHRRAELRRHLRFLEAAEPGFFLKATARAAAEERIDAGEVGLPELYEIGRLLFEHEYGFEDGLGGAHAGGGGRRSPFRRVHEGRFGGPETTTCTSCHWRGGPAGAGGLPDASFLYGDGDRVDGADARNPPPLQGAGVVEAMAAEMTAELHAIRDRLAREAAVARRPLEAKLSAKGVGFGVLRAGPDGAIDASGVEGVDADLVVKPFGWKGTVATLRDFVSESLQIHFGIQSEDLIRRHRSNPDPELVGSGADPDDPDGDGRKSEITTGQQTALVAFLAMQELPTIAPPETLYGFEPAAAGLTAPTATVFLDEWARGRELFDKIECSSCHVPMLVLKDPVFRTRSPVTGGELRIDLSRQGERPRVEYDARLGGYPVWLFSDLKRHDLGAENASPATDHGVPPRHYLTRRLWGLANSPPYFYDGRAASLDDAIRAHGGDAAESRKAFSALSRQDAGALRVYLLSLRRERSLVVGE
jgi:hypothetical protein